MDNQQNIHFEIFPWNKNLQVGIDLIDMQHRQLVNILNRLADHVAERSSLIELESIFNELVSYTEYHFNAEEEIWRANFPSGDEWLQSHEGTHLDFINQIIMLKEGCASKHLDEAIGSILGFLTNWLGYHILDTDRRMALAVCSLQAGSALSEAKNFANEQMSGATKVLIDTVLAMYDSLSSRTLELLRERSARKQAEEALLASEERWKFILDGAGEGVWDWDIQKKEIQQSSECLALLSFICSENVPESSPNIHPDDLLRFMENLQSHLDGNTETFVNKHRVVHANGQWTWVLTRGKVTNRDAHGQPLRMIGTHTDVTEREMASMVFNNTSEGMLVTDANSRIIAINPAYTVITGYTPEETLGKEPSIMSSGLQSSDFYQSMWEQIASKGKWAGELWNKRRSGEIYPQQLTINTVYNTDGTPNYHIGLFTDLTKQKAAEEQVWRQANFDSLTGLPTRQMLLDRLRLETGRASREGDLVAFLIIDIDNFKDINTADGYATGDMVIKEAAELLSQCVRSSDTVARVGGDEFAVILCGISEHAAIEMVAKKILGTISNAFSFLKNSSYLSASIGITVFPEDSADPELLLRHAEQAMYSAKNQGRNRFCYFTKFMQEAVQIRTTFTAQLREGLQKQQFHLHYQPIVNLRDGVISKAEALVRWNHPEIGSIGPATFIPIAEETGFIIELGNWIFLEATNQVLAWRNSFNPDFQISINKSPLQFRDDIDETHHQAWLKYLESCGLPGNSIVIEITESLLMGSSPSILRQLMDYRDQGVKVSLDDFGTGYSSLSYLSKFQIDYIKIDRSFINNLEKGSYHLALCEGIIAMAHKLGLKVVAEGIETEMQRDLLIKAECDYGQGYLFSKPVSPEEFERLFSPD